jgi:hypothetical protein
MTISLPLDEMTVEEKLQIIEMIWVDLSRNAKDLPPPAWHGDVLAERQAALDAGQDHYEDWETVKKKLRTLTS